MYTLQYMCTFINIEFLNSFNVTYRYLLKLSFHTQIKKQDSEIRPEKKQNKIVIIDSCTHDSWHIWK